MLNRLICCRIPWALALVAWAALQPPPAQASETLNLKVATEGTYYPMTYYDPAGNLTGFEVDLVSAMCDRARLDCEFVIMGFDGMLAALEQNRVDAIATGMRITEKRREVVDFVDKYYTAYARFVVCGDTQWPDETPASLAGTVIGTQSATTTAEYLDATYASVAEIRLYRTMDDAYLDLKAGRLDAVISNELVGYGFIESETGSGCRYLGERVMAPIFGDGVGIAIRQGEDEIRERLNAALKSLRGDGTYQTISEKYFPFSIY
jgi:polar amino acid transport system substrate-binding protein